MYDRLKQYDKAVEYDLKAIEIKKSISGETHSSIATSYGNIASTYEKLGQNEAAIEYRLKAIEIKSPFMETCTLMLPSHTNTLQSSMTGAEITRK